MNDDWGTNVPLDDVGGKVAIVGVGESEHTRASGRTPTEIAATAVERALDDAGLRPEDVDGVMISPAMPDQLDAAAFHEHFGTSHDLWESTAGGGMRWAATAPVPAAEALARGEAGVIVNSFAVAWATQRGSMTGGPGQMHAEERFKGNLEVPFGWFPQPVYFATIARRHMHQYGTTEAQLGAIAVACREHANATPAAVMHGRPLSLDDYLASPYLAEPFRKEDCCLISDGGAAYVMTTPERARDLDRPVGRGGRGRSRSLAHRHPLGPAGRLHQHAPGLRRAGRLRHGGHRPRRRRRGHRLRPVHDRLASCRSRTSASARRARAAPSPRPASCGSTAASLPYNPHGGMLSHAYVLGIAHVVEVVRQLRGEAANQVAGAEIGIYGGYTGPEAATLVLRAAS